jgi:hypothetical protein
MLLATVTNGRHLVAILVYRKFHGFFEATPDSAALGNRGSL